MKRWMRLLGLVAVALATTSSVLASEVRHAQVLDELTPDMHLGREITISYSTFSNRLALRSALRTARKQAAEQGIQEVVIIECIGSSPGRPRRRDAQ
jgi:hypothetical protein